MVINLASGVPKTIYMEPGNYTFSLPSDGWWGLFIDGQDTNQLTLTQGRNVEFILFEYRGIQYSFVPPAPIENVLFQYDYSDSSRLSEFGKEQGEPYQFVLENGKGRFELREGDPAIGGGSRIEYTLYNIDTLNGLHEYSFDLTLPSSYVVSSTQEHIMQLQGKVDGVFTSPALALVTRNGNMILECNRFPNGVSGGVQRQSFLNMAYTPGTTYNFKIQFDCKATNGVLKVWVDNVLKVDFSGSTGDSHRDAIGFKHGIYKSGAWDTLTSRVLYYDNLKIVKL